MTGKVEQYQNMILDLNDWFNVKIENLQALTEKDKKILFEGNDEKKIELPDDLKKGFFFGIQTAIEVLGEFPVKITKNK